MQPQQLPGQDGSRVLGLTGESTALRLTGRGPWVCISPWNFSLVDSTALPEQVCDAVMQSAFRSAGQRCSALRLLCVHAEIADAVIDMISGAARELRCGDPADLATDVGPVIDGEAFDNIQRHLTRLKAQARPVLPAQPVPKPSVHAFTPGDAKAHIKNQSVAQYQQALPAMDGVATEVTPQATAPVTALAAGQPVAYMTNRPLAQSLQAIPASVEIANLMAPQAFEVASISDLKEEIFGPVLHIVRWRGDPQAVIAQINALGYGLTLGIQTRIDSRAQALARAAHIGNVYINRNQIGAVVGVQPFGGEGQSGTGPKAGGPHYLYRFCAEQTITVNTTAAGGNVQLMA